VKIGRFGRYALLIILFLSLTASEVPPPPPVSYWLWAGLTEADLPPNTTTPLYIWQGTITQQGAALRYERKGLFPYPLLRAPVFLVFRLEGEKADPERLYKIFEKTADLWQRHGVTIRGLQLDFDSPTGKLLTYGNYLNTVRTALPNNYKLSVTGLGDWVLSGDPAALHRITQASDEIVFQLYQGRESFPEIPLYVERLRKADFPFRIGLLTNTKQEKRIAALEANPYYRGIVYFLQKPLVQP